MDYSPHLISPEPARIPRHVAIVMDGNRRWARERDLLPLMGHWKGAEALKKVVGSAARMGIKVLTVYVFSTENWSRSQEEIDALMHIIQVYLRELKQEMVETGISVSSIGNIDPLPHGVRALLKEVEEATSGGTTLSLVLALNYGARDDICRAVTSITSDCLEGKLHPQEISEHLFSHYLDTARWGDPELLIRTSGERRLSNFLLWQISYTEVYITNVLWPDFDERELEQALFDFQQRERRLGG